MQETEIRAQLAKYSWYHIIPLTDTLSTPGLPRLKDVVANVLRSVRSIDLKDKRVLDIGCRDGMFSFEAEKRGAREVIGIDNDLSRGAVEFLIPFFRSKVRMHQLNLYDLSPEQFGKFDVIIFPGVLYHLRYPFWALKVVREMLQPQGTLVLETALLWDTNQMPLLYCPTGDDSPYEPSSCTFFNVRGLAVTLQSMGLEVQQLLHQHTTAWTPHTPPGPNESRPERPGLRARLASLLWPRAKEPDIRVVRASYVCRYRPEIIDEHLAMYWDGTHEFHSTHRRAS
jgi:SAM-dependent methyltransferase